MYRDFCACFQSTVQIPVHPLLLVLHDPACLHLRAEYRAQSATVMPWYGVQGQLPAAFVLCVFCDPPPLSTCLFLRLRIILLSACLLSSLSRSVSQIFASQGHYGQNQEPK